MNYFGNFKNIYYPYSIGGKDILRIVKDITTNVRIRKEVLSNVTIYDEYDVQDGETPDIIAARYYGSSKYHWVILLANEMYDYLRDFPMSTQALDEYIDEKYNRFDSTSWSYVGHTVTATIPNHGISYSEGEYITVVDAYVSVGGNTIIASGLDTAMTVTSVTPDTVVFWTDGALTGTPVGGLTLYTHDRQFGIHHYEIDGFVVNADDAHSSLQNPDLTGAVEVTNYDYETAVNDAKRRIKLITPDVVSQITRELGDLV